MSPSEPGDPDYDPAEDPADDQDVDAQFRAIVSGLDLELPDDPPPASRPDADPPIATGPGSFEELRAWIDVQPDLLGDAYDDDDDDAADDESGDTDGDDAHYVPPTPPPVPRGDRVSRWAWAGAVGAPVGYVALALFDLDTSGLLGMALIVAFAAGFVTLVVRMKDGPRVDDDPDDGAVV